MINIIFKKIQHEVDKLIFICYSLCSSTCCLKIRLSPETEKGKLLERVGRKASGPPQIAEDGWAAEVKEIVPYSCEDRVFYLYGLIT